MLLGNFVWLTRCQRWLRHSSLGWKLVIAAFTAAQLAGLILILFLRFRFPGLQFLLTTPVVACIYLWHFLFIVPMMLVGLPVLLTRFVFRIARSIAGAKRAPNPVPTSEMSRRDFLRLAGCAAPAIATLGVTGFSLTQLRHFRIRKLVVPIAGLPPALEGLTIAHVTDLHVGQLTHGSILEEIVEATNALGADLVLATGDLINFDLKDLPAGLSVMTRLRAAHGVFMCEGNHDLFINPDEFRRSTRAAGLQLLVNQNAVVPIRGTSVQILGLQWGGGTGHPHDTANQGEAAIAKSMRDLLLQRQPDAFPIVLAHHPHAFDHADDIPLTLAGHTHGGQLMVTGELGCGPMIYRYWSGLYRRAARTLLVSNGVGNWFPLRTAAPAEIVHLTLQRA